LLSGEMNSVNDTRASPFARTTCHPFVIQTPACRRVARGTRAYPCVRPCCIETDRCAIAELATCRRVHDAQSVDRIPSAVRRCFWNQGHRGSDPRVPFALSRPGTRSSGGHQYGFRGWSASKGRGAGQLSHLPQLISRWPAPRGRWRGPTFLFRTSSKHRPRGWPA
jgi:hypothetical protein